MSSQHLSAIHVLKARLRLDEDEYRDVLQQLTGKRSAAAMSLPERARVRDHLQRQAQRQGGAVAATGWRLSGADFAKAKAAASPRERKLWALWHALHRAGLVQHTDRAALDAWVARTVQVSSSRFASDAQLDTCIEAAKQWLQRAGVRSCTSAATPKA